MLCFFARIESPYFLYKWNQFISAVIHLKDIVTSHYTKISYLDVMYIAGKENKGEIHSNHAGCCCL